MYKNIILFFTLCTSMNVIQAALSKDVEQTDTIKKEKNPRFALALGLYGLQKQARMFPEIAAIILDFFYPNGGYQKIIDPTKPATARTGLNYIECPIYYSPKDLALMKLARTEEQKSKTSIVLPNAKRYGRL